MLKKALILLFILVLSSVSYAQGDVTAVTLVALNMRDQPSQSGGVITKLQPQTTVIVEGRDANESWLLVHTPDGGARGWMALQYLQFSEAISSNFSRCRCSSATMASYV
mgnify:CR=1 FL=1